MFKKRQREKGKDPVKFSKIVVASVLISVIVFTVTMIAVFLRMGMVPDTLIASFFAFAGGEAGVLGLIKHGETKYNASDKSADQDSGPGGVG